MRTAIAITALASVTSAFPFVALQDGVDSSLLGKRQQSGTGAGSAANCPNNPNHVPAAPVTAKYPYNNAKNGKPGNGKGGYVVPHPDDTAHRFIAPDYTKDIRGPCPGLNVAANHGFLARDGIVTFNELVDAQQNVYNVGYDLATLLALLGLTLGDGDITTEKLSIGCDATSRTAPAGGLLSGSEPGLDGHDKFEADTSLTRNDYFLANGNNFKFNGTLFGYMEKTCNGNFNLQNLAVYRKQRYEQSLAENGNFYFGPLSLLLFGAASFLYELMPGGPDYTPDLATISSFFGAEKVNGAWKFNGQERIPANWTNRVEPYTDELVGQQIIEMYLLDPVLFGGNTAQGSFDGLGNFGSFIKNSSLVGPNGNVDLPNTACLLYQLATERIPASLNTFITPTTDILSFVASKIAPSLKNLGCPTTLT